MSNPSLRSPLIPRQPVPALQVRTLEHGSFCLAEDAATNFTLVVFYRGLHCPICLKYLLELGRLQPEFDRRGVKVVAISSDGRERAQAMADKLKAPALRMGYDLSLAKAREWGLFVSTSRGTTSIGIEEPALPRAGRVRRPGLTSVRALRLALPATRAGAMGHPRRPAAS
jgi:peroxiredoxin